MVFDGLGQRDVVRRKNQFHAFKMQSNSRKSQIFHEFGGHSECRANFACA
jgi:hypothetical protein